MHHVRLYWFLTPKYARTISRQPREKSADDAATHHLRSEQTLSISPNLFMLFHKAMLYCTVFLHSQFQPRSQEHHTTMNQCHQHQISFLNYLPLEETMVWRYKSRKWIRKGRVSGSTWDLLCFGPHGSAVSPYSS